MSLSKIYSYLLPFLLIIQAYEFPFLKAISLDYILLFGFSILFLIDIILNKKTVNIGSLIVSLILLIQSIIILCFSSNYNIGNSYTLVFIVKVLIWGSILSFSIPYIDRKIFIRTLVYVTTFSTFYLLIQSVFFYGASIKFPNGFNLGLIRYSAYNSIDIPINYYRPSSFYSEPAYYSTNILISLLYLLFDNTVNFKSRKKLIYLHYSGILLSASTAGIFLFLLLLIFYSYSNSKKMTKKQLIVLFFTIVIGSTLLLNYEKILLHMGSLGSTVLKSINKINYYGRSSRIGGSFDHLKKLDIKTLLFGYGLGNEYVISNGVKFYMNAATRTIIQCGIFGILILLIYLCHLFLKSNNLISKYVIIMIIAKCLTGNMLFTSPGIFAFTIVCLENYYCRRKKET